MCSQIKVSKTNVNIHSSYTCSSEVYQNNDIQVITKTQWFLCFFFFLSSFHCALFFFWFMFTDICLSINIYWLGVSLRLNFVRSVQLD